MAQPPQGAAAGGDAALSLVLTRRFEASPQQVFDAWIDPRQIGRWIGPRSIRSEVLAMDARPGGAYRIAMHRASGEANIVAGVYREVTPPERLVFTWTWENDWPENDRPEHKRDGETVVTLTFRAVGKDTEMTLRHERFASTASRDAHGEGWRGSFDKLADLLAGRPIAWPPT